MSTSRPERKFSNCDYIRAYKSWLEKPIHRSAAAMLVELGVIFAVAESGPPVRSSCSRCSCDVDPHTSTAQSPSVFCSERCEQEFVRDSLASLTFEDCIRMQDRLEMLLSGTRQPAA
jgi:hypothetical protein